VCPGIITIIWSLITSETIVDEENTEKEKDDDGPDDTLTELLNNQMTYEACKKAINEKGGIENFKKSSKPVQIELRQQNADIFTQSNNN